MRPYLILPSTTSHKREPILTTLEVFARLGFRDLDLNLSHLYEGGADVDQVRAALRANGQHVWIASGGWCDFYYRAPAIEQTLASVERQVGFARALDASRIRLFYGRLPFAEYTADSRSTIATNIRTIADRHPDMLFMFENHDGASLKPTVCREVLDAVDRPNVRMNFDPINFERHGANSLEALEVLRPLIAHVHLKGVKDGDCCEFGAGDLDLGPLLESLISGGYAGAFTVEYEGPLDRTVRLYEGARAAAAAIDRLIASIDRK